MEKRAHNFTDLTGKRFGRLLIIKPKTVDRFGDRYWLCQCDCGKRKIIRSSSLRRGRTKSCGCFHRDAVTTHGENKTYFYKRWHAIKNRCRNKERYSMVNVCGRWLDFSNFKTDMYDDYLLHVKKFGKKNTTIERVNNNKGYSPQNCKWATYIEQGNNRKSNIFITYNSQRKTVTQWHRELKSKINLNAFHKRLKRGWSLLDAAHLPLKYNTKHI